MWSASCRALDRLEPGSARTGLRPLGRAPFFWLQGRIALNAFVISATVLIRPRQPAFPPRPAENSKIIRVLEALRHDLPKLRDKPDPAAEELSRPTDTKAVLSIIEASSRQLNCERK